LPDALGIDGDVAGGDVQDAIAQPHQIGVALPVSSDAGVVEVSGAIDLDDQLGMVAGKVGNVVADGDLAAKVDIEGLQDVPELPLGSGGIVPQSARLRGAPGSQVPGI
jgi:hypothetical protein